ncbi:energy-coupling factor ABC transporter permease [Nocardioides sp. TRM66260-LWL]|uniref:energy-coupling factor ABC transporter permease n=1 Tax=Nocardioides sp. TRM66260-LWL TaxID=2874478 RepID=UPI001CC57FF2|nr:energy-coupling factor ABC transporter permease [Nocardioides sp. TRM66260-LWL]MBZ5732956.1 energy-coupling factor ABC transporter permease [Nocardioides sp. TRM66260-LWL]
MHVPDGFFDAPTSAATAVVAASAIGTSLYLARRRELDDRTAPLAGLVAAFVFATQMLNFPVAGGTSGHLMGGALAAVLVGPATAILCLSVVFLVQALLFADGGITALGTNILLMGVVTVLVGYGVFRVLQAVLPKRASLVPLLAGLGALVSVPAAALVFVGLFEVGGTVDVPLGTLASAMLGVHVLIGIGEAVITAAAVAAILKVRPDLVHGARRLPTATPLVVRTSPVATPAAPAAPTGGEA